MALFRTGDYPKNPLPQLLVSLCTALSLSLALALSGCAASLNSPSTPTSSIAQQNDAQTANPKRSNSVKIALLLPLAGFNRTAAIAKSMKQAGEMALFERNDPSIQLIVKDDKGTPEGARQAAQEAIANGAQIILGPLLSKSASGAADVARASNTPIISFSNDRKIAGRGVYLMSFLPDQEVERITNFAITRGKRRFAALIPDTVYGHAVEKTFRETVARSGGSILALERYPAKANGMLEPAKQIIEIIKESQNLQAPIDAIFLPGGQDTLPSLGPLIAYSNLDTSRIQLLGTGGWEFPNIGRDEAFVGGWYPSPDPRGWQEFSGRFAKNFGQAPPRLASLVYDAVNMAISLSKNPADRRYTAAALTQPTGFNGVDGLFRFTPNGLSQRGLAILQVKKFGSQVVDPAPRTLPQSNAAVNAGPGSNSGSFSFPSSSSRTSSPFGASLLAPN